MTVKDRAASKRLRAIQKLVLRAVYGGRHARRPEPLILMLLAIAVTLWCYNYRLSQYHRHPDPAQRADVARMWIQRARPALAVFQRLKVQSHLVPSPRMQTAAFSALPLFQRLALCAFPEDQQRFQAVHSFFSLRAPPHLSPV
jgi:hypothetical protein